MDENHIGTLEMRFAILAKRILEVRLGKGLKIIGLLYIHIYAPIRNRQTPWKCNISVVGNMCY